MVKDDLYKALDTLSDRQKRRIIAYCIHHKTQVEIAQEEGVSHKRISKSIKSGMKKLLKNRGKLKAMLDGQLHT